MSFQLDQKLSQDTYLITDLNFCRLLLMNDSQYPWLILVPRKASVVELYELEVTEQQELLSEIATVSRILKQEFSPDKLNIGALGNIVKQLHIHVIARYTDDIAWPGPVWGAHPTKGYDQEAVQLMINKIKQQLL